MASFKEALQTALANDRMQLLSINQNLMEVARATKKKPGFVKSAVTEELADGLMHRKRVAFILHIDADEMDAIVKQLDKEVEFKSIGTTASLNPEGVEAVSCLTKEEQKC